MAEIYVTSTADSGAGSLRQAIADAQDGDVILFDSVVFPQGQTTAVYLSSYITIDKSISIYGGESDGNGGYTSGAIKQYYVYRDVDDVKTKVVISAPDDAQDGETVLYENVCRVALDGQDATRCVFSNSSTNAHLLISGLCFKNGNSAELPAGGFYSRYTSINTLRDCTITHCRTNSNGGGIYFHNESQNTLYDCSIDNCTSAAGGGGVYSNSTSVNTLNACVFDGCGAASGGGVYSNSTSINTLNNCTIYACSATSNGGGVDSYSSSQNTLNGCIFDGCAATNGGGVYSVQSSQNTLNGCAITGCSATNNGGGVYAAGTSQNTLNGCALSFNTAALNTAALYVTSSSIVNINNSVFSDNDAIILGDAQGVINASKFDALTIGGTQGATTNVTIAGITVIRHANIRALGAFTIADGAALTLTGTATIGAATFTSEGRGYLAVLPGIDTSAATFDGVVLCAYGADVSNFVEVDGVLEWSADDPSVSVLIEREDNDAWTTLTQTTGESLDYYLPPKVNLRLFDGERFLTTATPDSRTYFYIGGAEGSFDDAEDWSLTKNGTAIPQSPTIADCAFVIQGAEGDVAISKGSANVTNATIIPAGTNDIAVTVDEATVLAGTERFTGTLTTTGDVAITGDASQLAIVVDGTLEVAGSLKLATLTLTSGSSVVFASADDVLVVTDSATVNDATFSCEEPTAYFTAPVGTDLTQATFTNVYVATKGAEVVSVTGSRFGKNYSINIVSEDNTLPVTVEYRLEGTTEWIVADPAFVGTTFQIRLDDDATFRVYNGETFSEATMKVYGLYNEMAAIVEIGYLI